MTLHLQANRRAFQELIIATVQCPWDSDARLDGWERHCCLCNPKFNDRISNINFPGNDKINIFFAVTSIGSGYHAVSFPMETGDSTPNKTESERYHSSRSSTDVNRYMELHLQFYIYISAREA